MALTSRLEKREPRLLHPPQRAFGRVPLLLPGSRVTPAIVSFADGCSIGGSLMDADAVLESRISDAKHRMLAANNTGDRDGARVIAQELAFLVAQRSPEQIRRMEFSKGLL